MVLVKLIWKSLNKSLVHWFEHGQEDLDDSRKNAKQLCWADATMPLEVDNHHGYKNCIKLSLSNTHLQSPHSLFSLYNFCGFFKQGLFQGDIGP
jgi:hypothetical protein